jgi:16S rRNA (cytosine967-C5)-methyltransferase
MGARTTALGALIACRKQGAWADGVLKEYIRRDGLDRRDAAFASRLCYGVLQNKMLLDHYIGCCVTGSIKKLQPIVLDILRLGVYQLLLMDRVPDSAAVNEAVEQTKKYANRSAAGLVNAVLRRVVREGDTFPSPKSFSVKYSHPEELVTLLKENVPKGKLEDLLLSHNQAPETIIHINTLRCNPEDAVRSLEESGISLTAHPWLENAYTISGTGNIEHLPAFSQGMIQIQDAAARLAVLAADIEPGMQVLDCCAAPGGKSYAAAAIMQNQGNIVSCDIHPHKIELIAKGAQRLGIDIISPTLQDASEFHPQWERSMDVVIADVPCSGLGVIRKKPDIRYKDLSQTENLPEIQISILENVCRYVKPGGVILYSTCTILHRENEDVVTEFLKKHSEYTVEPFHLPDAFPENQNNGMLTLFPSIHGTDGFFICKLRRAL